MIKIGDYIKLRSTAFQDLYKKSQEWNDHYICVNQFQHVCLWFEKLHCRGEYAKMIFDNSISKVLEIEQDESGCPLFVRTELFWIAYPDALAKNEIELLTEVPEKIGGFEDDKSMIKDLEFFELEYKKGLFDILERENNKYAVYKRGFYLMRRSDKWADV